MTQATKIPGTEEAWDNGTLGADEEYVQVAPKALQDEVNQSLGMQAISIRLPKELVEQYRAIARIHKIGYQPLMRDALARFASYEMKRLLVELADEREQEEAERETSVEEHHEAA
jgi:predicted transcriptional regulator